MSLPPGLWPRLWRAAWLLFGVANASLQLAAETNLALLVGRPLPVGELWLRVDAVEMIYPFDHRYRIWAHNVAVELSGHDAGQLVVMGAKWQ